MKWIFNLCLLVCPIWGWSESSPLEGEMNLIEKEIQELKEHIHHIEKEQMKEDIEGQEYMIADWEAYSQEMEKIHQKDLERRELESKIKKLEERKSYLRNQKR